MTSTELTPVTSIPTADELAAQMEYARAVAPAALLPAAYRGKPADVMIAVNLGAAVGIAPAQALYEIYVVNGRPSPSANLMAALVRRAGHRLRIQGDAQSCTATLVRADDPGAPFEATWTIEQAKAAGLAGKDTWKAYPQAMLRARAISEVVRMGASEALLGMEYSREEMQDVEVIEVRPAGKPAGTDALRQAVAAPAPAAPAPAPAAAQPETGEAITDAQRRAMFAAFAGAGFTTDARSAEGKAARLEYIGRVVGAEVASTNDLTKAQASQVLDALAADAAEQTETAGESDELDASWMAGEGR